MFESHGIIGHVTWYGQVLVRSDVTGAAGARAVSFG